MSKKFLCDPTVRAVGKPFIGRAIGTMMGGVLGCSASGRSCSPANQLVSAVLTATIGYSIGAIWDNACKK